MPSGYSALFGAITIDASNEGVAIHRGGVTYDCDSPSATYATIEELLDTVETTINGIVPGDAITLSLSVADDDYGCHVVFSSTEEFMVESGSMLELLGMTTSTMTGLFEITGDEAPIQSVVTPGVSFDSYSKTTNRSKATIHGNGKVVVSRYSCNRRRSIQWGSLKEPQFEALYDMYFNGVFDTLPVYYMESYESLVAAGASNRMDKLLIDYVASPALQKMDKQYENSRLFDVGLELFEQ
jgi:hypothetical protein